MKISIRRKRIILVPSDPTVNWCSLAKSISNFLRRAICINSNNGLFGDGSDTKRQWACRTIRETQLVPRRRNGMTSELAASELSFSYWSRVIDFGARVCRKSLKPSNSFEILMLLVCEVGWALVVDLGQRRVLCLSLAIGIANHGRVSSKKVFEFGNWLVLVLEVIKAGNHIGLRDTWSFSALIFFLSRFNKQ